MAGIENLKKDNVDFNILSMVSSSNEDKANQIFRFFIQEKLVFQQYIPYVEFNSLGTPLDYTVSSNDWGKFLLELFRNWYPKYVKKVSIRNFDNVINFLATGTYFSCSMRGACDQYLVVEHDGGVYPCDFFVEPQFKIGNIKENSWMTLLSSPIRQAFASKKNQWNEACSTCEFLDYCSGDCLKTRFSADRDPNNLSWFCAGNGIFLKSSLPIFKDLAQACIQRFLPENDSTVVPPVSRSPDSLCFCGSGKKYKNCNMPAQCP